MLSFGLPLLRVDDEPPDPGIILPQTHNNSPIVITGDKSEEPLVLVAAIVKVEASKEHAGGEQAAAEDAKDAGCVTPRVRSSKRKEEVEKRSEQQQGNN